MGMNAVISRKYGWNTIAWMENHVSGTLSSKIYWVSKSIPAAKPQNFVEISEAQKLHGQNIWNLIFFLSEKTRLYRYYQNKNQRGVTSSSYTILIMILLIKLYL